MRPNFFLLLEIDPDAPWDAAGFETALREHRQRWSRERTGLKERAERAKGLLNLVSEIEHTMRDPASREAERTKARQEQVADRTRRQHELGKQLHILAAKGFLYDVEKERLMSGADAELRDRIERLPVRELAKASTDLDRPAQEGELRRNLEILGEQTLYDALRRVDEGITQTSRTDRLLAAADALYAKGNLVMDKQRPDVAAMQTLGGIARVVFANDKSRRRHDMWMRLRELDELIRRYESALALTKVVHAKQVEQFLGEAKGKGVELEIARDWFVAHFTRLRWSIQLPAPESEVRLESSVICPRCATLNPAKAASCQGCAQRLQEPCPDCGATVFAAGGGCGECGFPVGQGDWVRTLVSEGESATAEYDFEVARARLAQAGRIWRLPGDSEDELAAQLRQANQRLALAQAEAERAKATLTAQVEKRRYYAARKLLLGLPARFPYHAQRLAEAENAVRYAEELYQQAKRRSLSDARRAVLYAEALQRCADHDGARRELSQIPPPPPSGLRVESIPSRSLIRLSWQASQDPGVAYVVVRALGRDAPLSAEDLPGQRRLALVSDAAWDDRSPETGAFVRYAVYAERAGTLSASAAVAPEPVFLPGQVRLDVRPGDREVVLAWTLPPRATAVELVRSEAEAGTGETSLDPLGNDRLVDTGLRNGVRYRYAARAVYSGKRYSDWTTREVAPNPPPLPPPAPYVRGGPPPPDLPIYRHKVELRWAAPAEGEIKVVAFDRRPAFRPGDAYPEEHIFSAGVVIQRRTATSAEDYWIGDTRLRRYVPVLVLGGMGYVGEARNYAAIAEVDELTVEYRGDVVRVGWRWPGGCKAVLIGYDPAAEPPDPTAASAQVTVGRQGDEALGSYELPSAGTQRLFVLVASVVRELGEEFVSSGVSGSARRPKPDAPQRGFRLKT